MYYLVAYGGTVVVMWFS